jgi:hypothetical protein
MPKRVRESVGIHVMNTGGIVIVSEITFIASADNGIRLGFDNFSDKTTDLEGGIEKVDIVGPLWLKEWGGEDREHTGGIIIVSEMTFIASADNRIDLDFDNVQ